MSEETRISSSTADKLGAATTFLSSLTPRSVALGLIVGVCALVGYAVWEQRAVLLPAYLGSTYALTGTGVAVTLALIGLIVMDLVGRLEARAETAMRTYAEALQVQINMQTLANSDLRVSVLSLTAEHAACQRRLEELALRVSNLGSSP